MPGVKGATQALQLTSGTYLGLSTSVDLQPSALTVSFWIDQNMAVWFVGYTPDLAAAAMIAGANGDGHWVTLNGQTVGGELVGEAFGSTEAGPIWGDAMKAVQRRLPDRDFVSPPAWVFTG